MLENGEIINLEGKEYICVTSVVDNGVIYLYLMSNFEPLEIRFAKQLAISDDDLKIEIVTDDAEKVKVLNLFSKVIS